MSGSFETRSADVRVSERRGYVVLANLKASPVEKADITFFDPKADWTVVERGLPHWSQAGCVCFVTWRLNDSLPMDALERINRELAELLSDEGFDPNGDW